MRRMVIIFRVFALWTLVLSLLVAYPAGASITDFLTEKEQVEEVKLVTQTKREASSQENFDGQKNLKRENTGRVFPVKSNKATFNCPLYILHCNFILYD